MKIEKQGLPFNDCQNYLVDELLPIIKECAPDKECLIVLRNIEPTYSHEFLLCHSPFSALTVNYLFNNYQCSFWDIYDFKTAPKKCAQLIRSAFVGVAGISPMSQETEHP